MAEFEISGFHRSFILHCIYRFAGHFYQKPSQRVIMLKLILFTIILAILLYIADHFFIPSLIHAEIWVILGFFFALAIMGHRITQIAFQRNKDNVAIYYFVVMLIRLLISAVFIAIYLYKGIQDKMVFIGNFFILYLLYVAFEINSLLTNLRRNSRQQERHEPHNFS
jgi:hypothetical protein